MIHKIFIKRFRLPKFTLRFFLLSFLAFLLFSITSKNAFALPAVPSAQLMQAGQGLTSDFLLTTFRNSVTEQKKETPTSFFKELRETVATIPLASNSKLSLNTSDIFSAFKNNISQTQTPKLPIVFEIAPSTSLLQSALKENTTSVTSPQVSTPSQNPTQENKLSVAQNTPINPVRVSGATNNESLASALRALLRQEEFAAQLRGPQGPQGPAGPQGASGSSGSPLFFIPPNPGANFSGGTLFSATDLSSTRFVTSEARIATLTVTGGSALSGFLSFSGTTHAGLQLNSLTTAQRNAINPSSGMTIFNTTVSKMQVYNGTTWKNVGNPEISEEVTSGTSGSVLFVDSSGNLMQDNANFSYNDTTNTLSVANISGSIATTGAVFSGVLSFTGTGHAGLKINNLTTVQRDLLVPASGMTIFNTTVSKMQVYNGSTWKNVGNPEIGAEVTSGTNNSILFVSGGNLAEDADLTFLTDTLTATKLVGSTSLVINGGTALTTTNQTGTGSLVLATSPTLVTPALGTPSALVLTNATGLPAAAVLAGTFGTGAYVMDTSLTVPTVIGGTGTTSDLNLKTTSGVGATGADMHFLVGNNGATEAMTILNSGYIGISTTAPQSLLDVRGPIGTGTASSGILTLSTKEETIIDGDELGRINFNAPNELSLTDAILVGAAIWAEADAEFTASVNSTDLVFATGTSEAAVEAMRISSQGVTSIDNLNIGSLNFDTNAGILSWIDMPITSSASSGTVESYSAQLDGNALLTVYGLSDGAGGIKSTGVGIGTSTPSSLLHAKGNLLVPLTGTVVTTVSSSTVTGTSTLFTTELAVGDSIKIGTEIFTVSAIFSATSLTLDSNVVTAVSGATAYRDPVLFTVDNGDAVNKLSITRGGDVGIKTAAPLKTLDVAGSTRITGTASSTITLTGTADPTASTTLTGTNTLFTTQLVIGDIITVNSETRRVTAIASATSLTVNTAFTDTASAAITKLYSLTGTGDPNTSTTVTGTGTLFTTELVVGDRITIADETRTVTAIASATSLTVDTAFTTTVSVAIQKLPATFIVRDSSNEIQMAIDDSGLTSINNLQTGSLNFETNAGAVSWVDMPVAATYGGSTLGDNSVLSYTAGLNGTSVLTIYGLYDLASVGVDNLGVGIGTTLPQSLLDVQGPIGTGATSAGILTLATKELTIVDGDELGRINFNSPLESDGSDSILAGAAIWAEADDTFSTTVNSTELVFATATTSAAIERMRLDSAGNLGIGTATPTGTLMIDGSADQIQLLVQGNATQTSNLVVFENSAGTDVFTVSNTGATTIPAGVNLNLGANTISGDSGNTITVGYRLHASGGYRVGASGMGFGYDGATTQISGVTSIINTLADISFDTLAGDANGMNFTGGRDTATGNEVVWTYNATINKATSGNYTGIKLNVTETAAPGTDDRLLDLQVGSTTRFLVTNNGNIGIRSSTKLSQFTVTPAADVTNIGGTTTASATTTITGSGTTFLSSIGIGDRISLSSASSTYATVTAIASDTSLTVSANLGDGTSQTINVKRSVFRLDDASSATKFVVNDLGNVGIGTTSPDFKLEIETDIASDYSANFFNDGNNANRYGIQIQAGADDATGTTYYLNALDGDGGQVGYIANTAGTFALTDPSDISTKTNITDTTLDAFGIISNLRVVDFNRIQNPDGPRITGFIAQEVQSVYPQMVNIGPTGLLGITKESLIPVAIKAIQELNLNLEGIAAMATPIPGSNAETFTTAFFNNVYAKIGTWLADATNGVTKIFTGEIDTKSLCVSDDTGAKTCITKSQLDSILSGAGVSGSSSPAPEPIPEPEEAPVSSNSPLEESPQGEVDNSSTPSSDTPQEGNNVTPEPEVVPEPEVIPDPAPETP